MLILSYFFFWVWSLQRRSHSLWTSTCFSWFQFLTGQYAGDLSCVVHLKLSTDKLGKLRNYHSLLNPVQQCARGGLFSAIVHLPYAWHVSLGTQGSNLRWKVIQFWLKDVSHDSLTKSNWLCWRHLESIGQLQTAVSTCVWDLGDICDSSSHFPQIDSSSLVECNSDNSLSAQHGRMILGGGGESDLSHITNFFVTCLSISKYAGIISLECIFKYSLSKALVHHLLTFQRKNQSPWRSR